LVNNYNVTAVAPHTSGLCLYVVQPPAATEPMILDRDSVTTSKCFLNLLHVFVGFTAL